MRTLVIAVVAVAGLVGAVISGASGATVSTSTGPPDVRIVNINLLHGVFCPPATNHCQATDRFALLGRQLEDAGCPEVVGLQEIDRKLAKIIARARSSLCDGRYRVVFAGPPRSLDTEQVLTTLAITGKPKIEPFLGNFRTASRIVLESRLGPLVVVVTHQDGDREGPPPPPCKQCPPPCRQAQAGAYACQTITAASLADAAGGAKAIRVLMGDFNVTPASARYQVLVADGWVDSYVAAGNPECDPATGTGCTSGRDDKSVEALKDPNAKESERIDFIFVKAPNGCTPGFDPADDADGDGLGTGLFNATPATNGPGGLVWPSDHTGVSADLSCTKKG